MGDSEFVTPEICKSHHDLVDYKFESIGREIRDVKSDISDVKRAQDAYNATIKNIYYTLLIIAFGTILTLAGVVLGRAVDFHIPL
jgi:hypothetical protein